MPDDYEDKFRAAKEKRGDQYAHLDIPDLKKFRPRKRLDEEVLEQEVYGIDPFTYNMLLNTMPADTPEFTEKHKQLFIEEVSKEPSPLTLLYSWLKVALAINCCADHRFMLHNS
jgi:hypothetical protein